MALSARRYAQAIFLIAEEKGDQEQRGEAQRDRDGDADQQEDEDQRKEDPGFHQSLRTSLFSLTRVKVS